VGGKGVAVTDWTPNRGERVVGTGVFRVLGVVLLAVVATALVAPRQPNIPRDPVWVWVGFVACAGLWLAAWATRRRLGSSRPLRWLVRRAGWVSWGVTLVGVAASLVVAVNLVYPVGWDAKTMANLGSRLADGPAPDFYYRYLSRYPNQVPFAAVSRWTFELRGSLGWDQRTIFAALNAGCVGIMLQSVFVVVRRLRGALAGLAAQVAGIVLVGLSPWMAVPYTDVVTMPLPILGTALALAALALTAAGATSRRRVAARVAATVLGVLAVAVVALGYVIKTTPVATMGGALALGVLVLASRLRHWRAAGVTALVVVAMAGAFLGASSGLRTALSNGSGLDLALVDTTKTPPLPWWVAMGMGTTQGDTTRYGAYDKSMVAAIAHMDGPQMAAYSSNALEQRWHALGVGGYTEFAANKVAWNLGDGMFWAWGEGPDARTTVPRHGPLTDWVVSWSHPSGAYYGVRAGLVQGLWLMVLLTAGVGLLVRPYRRGVALLVVSVVGIILFTLVLQGRPRYLFVYVPLFVALAASVVPVARRGGRGDVGTGYRVLGRNLRQWVHAPVPRRGNRPAHPEAG
jgi:hypothetical protein